MTVIIIIANTTNPLRLAECNLITDIRGRRLQQIAPGIISTILSI